MDNVNELIVCAGFGGQGIMTLGKVLATAGMTAGYYVTWMPSYGAEVRGGTANAKVCISSDPVAAPAFLKGTTAFIMNGPSLDKFENKVISGGLIIVNSSMIKRKVDRKDIEIVEAPLTDEAIQIGNVKVANIVAAGIYITKKKLLSKDVMEKAINTMAKGREELIAINLKALDRGIEIGKKS